MPPSLTITTIQPDLIWEDKAANLRRLETQILSIPGSTELVVLPEMFSTGFSMKPEVLAEPMSGATVNWMREIAARRKIILTGSLIIEEEGRYFNRLIWMLPNGQYGYYDKRHRFAYAGENGHYTAGCKRLVASVKGWRVLLLVCYDLRFPVWSRQTPQEPEDYLEPATDPAAPGEAALEYDLIIYVANWPESRSLAWKTLLQARAIENQSFVVGVNRVGDDGNSIYHSGDSMVVGPLGELLYHGVAKEEVHTVTLEKDALEEVRKRFPFWRDADNFSIEP
ncbi:nitrilase family protein [Puia dinghuensis]|uniref:Omega-amidase YafV n=1 Tax=Puia dinghuensis TaxID=1792502 RepID=A0A8J2UFK5_9BACT|nr:nitrilase family protein [Puia dinghuensis]GGB10903.1 amidohydrolase [Puia dinghuensis]